MGLYDEFRFRPADWLPNSGLDLGELERIRNIPRDEMDYTNETVKETVDRQRTFFRSGKTLDVEWRIEQLKRLKLAIQVNEYRLTEALAKDLSRSEAEAYFCDIGTVILEINEMIRGLRKWAKPETHFSGLICFPSVTTKVYKMPYGVSLIISPFNFPVLLTVGALIASLAGGNTAVIKASSKSPACTEAMQEMNTKLWRPGCLRNSAEKPDARMSAPASITVSCIIRHIAAATAGFFREPNTGRPSAIQPEMIHRTAERRRRKR